VPTTPTTFNHFGTPIPQVSESPTHEEYKGLLEWAFEGSPSLSSVLRLHRCYIALGHSPAEAFNATTTDYHTSVTEKTTSPAPNIA
jgi:hypothetical protein